MHFPLFISRRIASGDGNSFSRIIINLATIATALSVAIMIVAIAVVQGFKKNIEDKLYVFWDDINIVEFSANNLLAQSSIEKDKDLENKLAQLGPISSVHPYAIKPCIIKGNGLIIGLKLKGVRPDFPLKSNTSITYGGGTIDFSDPKYGKSILLSNNLMNRINVKIGDEIFGYFIEEGQTTPRVRKLKIAGTYHTGVGEIDNSFAICDIRLIQQLNNWSANTISGYQLKVKDRKQAAALSGLIYNDILKEPLISETVADIYPGIISWINVQNINAQILLFIMSIVAIINIMTALLIFILERTKMIGVLKSLGMKDGSIQKIFLFHASIISLKGVIIGLVVGLIICFVQYKFKIITLDEEVYYMKYAPISWEWGLFILIAVSTVLLTFLLMIIPSILSRRVNIVNALKFK